MIIDFETCILCKPSSKNALSYCMSSFHFFQNIIVDRLYPKLNSCCSQFQSKINLFFHEPIGTGLNCKPYAPVLCILVNQLRFFQILSIYTIHSIKSTLNEPLLIALRPGCECTPHNDEVNFIRWMSYCSQLLYPRLCLLVWVKIILCSPKCCWLVPCVTLGSALLRTAWAVYTFPMWTWEW